MRPRTILSRLLEPLDETVSALSDILAVVQASWQHSTLNTLCQTALLDFHTSCLILLI